MITSSSRRSLAALACFALAAISFADNARADEKRPNILFLLSDDQRPDTIHTLGNGLIQTPHLDRLVREGTAFTRAVCANPICTPSRAEILSGCTGFRNGVLDFGRKIDPALALWPRTMQQAGYRTYYVGKWHNDGRPTQRGYDETLGLYAGGGGALNTKPAVDRAGRPVTGYRGWVFQTDDGKKFPEKGVGLQPDISADFADAAIELLQRKSDKPFFLHVNFTAPHDPLFLPTGWKKAYPPAKMPLPPNFLSRHPFDHGNFDGRDEKLFAWPRTKKETQGELAAYYAIISHMDAQIGRILDTLDKSGQAKNTVVIFASDHGLGMGSHGIRGKQNMYEHTVNVPLLIRGPGLPAGKQRDAQCYLRDLFPTACELAGIDIPKTVQGKSLKPVLTGEVKSLYPHVFCYFRRHQRMVRTDRYKLIHYPHINRDQLFDLKADPHEKNDLSADEKHAATFARLKKILREWQREMNDPVLASKQ
jgi:arylsulfatase A-like enzyme